MRTKVGILGGGQLGKMLAQEATKLDVDLWFMDKSFDAPVARMYPFFVQGDFNNYDDVLAFGSQMDVISVEIENVNTAALAELEKRGKIVRPQSRVLDIIKDKGIQKQFYLENGIASSDFFLVEGAEEIRAKVEAGALSMSFVQKSRTEGYDGKGVLVINSSSDLDHLLPVPSVIEQKVDIHKELAVIVARNSEGEMTTFPITEMVFNKKGHLLDYLIAPAEVSDSVIEECNSLAKEIISKLDMTGLLAVEFFLNTNGAILVNEIAPRPHNSGHHTMDAGNYSQYNLHLRTLLDFSLPQLTQDKVALMINILGEEGHQGKVNYVGLADIMSMDNVYPHLYGKVETRPLRKMGHVNIVGNNKKELLEKMAIIKSKLKVHAWETE